MQCTNTSAKIKFIPYYCSNTIASLIIKNNQGPPISPLKKTNIMYQYQCSHGDWAHHNNKYIGLTTTTLSRQLTMHLASDGPKQHALENHDLTLIRDVLVNNTEIIFSEFNHNKLSLLIQKLQPSMNIQSPGLTEHINFSHSLPLQLLDFFLPVFTHSVPTIYISIVITLTVLISILIVLIIMLTVLITVLTLSTKIGIIPFPGSAPLLLPFPHWLLMR